MLEACQYLPDIVQLQRQMFDEFHHRIKHRVSRNETMQEFIRRRRTGIQLYMREYQPFMIDIACYTAFFHYTAHVLQSTCVTSIKEWWLVFKRPGILSETHLRIMVCTSLL